MLERVRRQKTEPAVPDKVRTSDDTANITDKCVSETANNGGETDSREVTDDRNELTESPASATQPVNSESSAIVARATACLLATSFSL